MAAGFERQQAKHVFERVIQVGAFIGLATTRDQPKPLQTHHMIDAQATGMGQVGTQHLDERAIAVALEPFGREPADAPVLA